MATNPRGRDRPSSAMVGAVDRLCESLLGDTPGLGSPKPHHWHPPTDVFECDRVYVIRVAVSGLRHEVDGAIQDATVVVEDDTVVIRGNRIDSCRHTKRAFFQMEINYGPFERRVRFTTPFDRDNIHAEYRDGFLEIVIPKAPRTKGKTTHIQVRS